MANAQYYTSQVNTHCFELEGAGDNSITVHSAASSVVHFEYTDYPLEEITAVMTDPLGPSPVAPRSVSLRANMFPVEPDGTLTIDEYMEMEGDRAEWFNRKITPSRCFVSGGIGGQPTEMVLFTQSCTIWWNDINAQAPFYMSKNGRTDSAVTFFPDSNTIVKGTRQGELYQQQLGSEIREQITLRQTRDHPAYELPKEGACKEIIQCGEGRIAVNFGEDYICVFRLTNARGGVGTYATLTHKWEGAFCRSGMKYSAQCDAIFAIGIYQELAGPCRFAMNKLSLRSPVRNLMGDLQSLVAEAVVLSRLDFDLNWVPKILGVTTNKVYISGKTGDSTTLYTFNHNLSHVRIDPINGPHNFWPQDLKSVVGGTILADGTNSHLILSYDDVDGVHRLWQKML